MLLEIESVEFSIAHLLRPQGYRKLTDTLTATFAGLVKRDGDKESDIGEIYKVAGDELLDGKYFVKVLRFENTIRAFISAAQIISVPLPDRGRMGVYLFDELALPSEEKTERLEPTSPLYRALLAGFKAVHPSRTPEIV